MCSVGIVKEVVTARVEPTGPTRRGDTEMRRTAMILAVVALMVVSSSGVALAAYEVSITGTDGEDIISGTGKSEHISGFGGDDQLNGGGGDDLVEGGLGSDELGDGSGGDTVNGNGGADNLIGQSGDTSVDRFYGSSGDDTVQSKDVPAFQDTVECGAGTDTVYADKADVVGDDCEQVRAW
jgi:Ca2+-binding RTX toxin-like protein